MTTDEIRTAIRLRFAREGWESLDIRKMPSEFSDYDDVFLVGLKDTTRVVGGKEAHPGVCIRMDAADKLVNLSRIQALWYLKIDDAARTLKALVQRSTN